MKKKFLNAFEFKNETETSADLYFYGDITSDYWGAWQSEDQYPESIKNFLSEHADKDINIYINSGGGSVFAGIAIYNMIRRHAQKNKVKITVDGLAGSIASVIAFAGSEPPKIPSNAFLMIHNPWILTEGNAEDLRKAADDLDEIREGILNIYEDHLKEGVAIDDIKKLMDAETWLNGAEVENYFNIEQTAPVEYSAAVGDYLNRARNIPQALKKASAPDLEAEKAKRDDEAKRDAIKRITIQSYMKGDLNNEA